MNQELEQTIRQQFPDAVLAATDCKGTLLITIKADQLLPVCRFVRDSLEFDFPDCVTGIDTGKELEVVYTLWSTVRDNDLSIKVVLPYDAPEVDSVTEVWKGANWHEREVYDLLGVRFRNHPDLRRILLPESFQGHPLRKEYQETD